MEPPCCQILDASPALTCGHAKGGHLGDRMRPRHCRDHPFGCQSHRDLLVHLVHLVHHLGLPLVRHLGLHLVDYLVHRLDARDRALQSLRVRHRAAHRGEHQDLLDVDVQRAWCPD